MKYLCLAYYDVKAFETLSKSELAALEGQCPRYDAQLRATGRLVMQASLGDVQATTCIRPKNGKPTITDGPYTETKEQVGGFFIVEAKDLDEAIRVASNHPAAHVGALVGWGIELRPIEGFEQPG